MAGRGPTLINLPPPPSDPATPSELGPGTPNSTTTSLSTLSVVAIKDGLVGHGGRGAGVSATTLEAERADRISRLAGLERVSTVRGPSHSHLNPGMGMGTANAPPGYFDHMVPQVKERSTVGSASATGSVGGRTTWASGSVDYDNADKMSEDQDDGVSSTGGFSDEGNASLVGFGEGAGSTVSGPVSTMTGRAAIAQRQNSSGSPTTPRSGAIPPYTGTAMPMSGVIATGSAAGSTDPRMMDGITYDQDIIDTTVQSPPPISQYQQPTRGAGGAELAETIIRDRITDAEPGRRAMGMPEGQNLGRFTFEKD